MSIEPSLAQKIDGAGQADRFSVIVTLRSADDLPAVLGRNLQPTAVFRSIAAFAATLGAAEIRTLAAAPEVKLVELDREAHALRPGRDG
jgi:hypothetical protein